MDPILKLGNDHLDHSALISDFEATYRYIRSSAHYDSTKLITALYPLRLDMEIHFAKEEYAIFPNLEHPLIPVLIDEHIILKGKLSELDELINAVNDHEEGYGQIGVDELKTFIDSFCFLRNSHIEKEDMILFPYLVDNTDIALLEVIRTKLNEFDNIAAIALL